MKHVTTYTGMFTQGEMQGSNIKNQDIGQSILKILFCLYFGTEPSVQNVLKSGYILNTGISAQANNTMNLGLEFLSQRKAQWHLIIFFR